MKRTLALGTFGLLLGFGIALAYGGSGLFERIAAFPLYLLGATLAMIFAGWNCNAGRLRLMLGGIAKPMGHGRALATVMATEFAINATPAGSGGLIAYVYLLKRHGAPATSAAAMYATDIMMDMLVFSSALVIVTLAMFFHPAQLHIGWEIGMLAGLLVAMVVLGWAGAKNYRTVLLWIGRRKLIRRVTAANRRRLTRTVLRFREALHLVLGFSRARLFGIFLCCLGHWVLRYSVLYVIITGMDSHVDLAYSYLVQMLAQTAGHFTMLPGGSGGVELSFTALLAPVLDHATLGAVLLMWRFALYYWYLIACAPVFFLFVGKALWQLLGNGSSAK
jgi:uncharacterized protein (TIRG00374 family)